jgi:enterochelin esterase-like enzyme
VLLTWWFLALLIVAAAAFPPLAVALGIRRRRRIRDGRPVIRGWRLGLRRLALALGTLIFGLAATAAAVNDHYSYIPSFHALFGDVSPDLVSHPVAAKAARARAGAGVAGGGEVAMPVAAKKPDHGTVEKVQVGGPVSGIGERDTYVYLPPEYFDPAKPDERFPVLYMLHGSPGISVDWLRAAWIDRALDDLLAKHRIAPFIVVLPDVNGGYRRDTECEDIPGGPHVQTYLVRDVVNYVDANYRTIGNREARAIGGLSTGGYCAVNLTLRHQDVFSGMVSHSGYDRPDQNLYTGNLFGGDRNEERANIPGEYLPTIPLTQPLGAYLDVGQGDNGSRRESAAMAKVFEQRGVSVAFHDFVDESHSWLAWRRNLYSSLPWVSSWFVTTGASAPLQPGDKAVLASPAPAPATAPAGTPGPEAAPAYDNTEAPDPLHIAAPADSKPATVERTMPPQPRTAAATRAGGATITRHHPLHPGAAPPVPAPGPAPKHRPLPGPAHRGAS